MIFCFYISEVQQVNQTDISYNDSTSPITDSVSYGPLKDSNYSGVTAVCVSVTQTQHLFIEYDFKVDDRTSSIRLSIIILGGFCIVMILLHVSLSVITWHNNVKIEPVFIQIEERNIHFIWDTMILLYMKFNFFLQQMTAVLALCIIQTNITMIRNLQYLSAIWYNYMHTFWQNKSLFAKYSKMHL